MNWAIGGVQRGNSLPEPIQRKSQNLTRAAFPYQPAPKAFIAARMIMNHSAKADMQYSQNLRMTMLIVQCTALWSTRKTAKIQAATQ